MGSGCSADLSEFSAHDFLSNVVPSERRSGSHSHSARATSASFGTAPLSSVAPHQRPVPPRATGAKNRARSRGFSSSQDHNSHHNESVDIAALMAVDAAPLLAARTPTRRPTAPPHHRGFGIEPAPAPRMAGDLGIDIAEPNGGPPSNMHNSVPQPSHDDDDHRLRRRSIEGELCAGAHAVGGNPNGHPATANETDSEQVLSPNAVSDVCCHSQCSTAGSTAFVIPQSPTASPQLVQTGSFSHSNFRNRSSGSARRDGAPAFSKGGELLRQCSASEFSAFVEQSSSPNPIYVLATPTGELPHFVPGTAQRSACASSCSMDGQDPLDMMVAGGGGNCSTTTSILEGRQSIAASSVAEDPPFAMYRSFHSSSMHTSATAMTEAVGFGQSLGGSLVESVLRCCGGATGGMMVVPSTMTMTAASSQLDTPSSAHAASASRSRPFLLQAPGES